MALKGCIPWNKGISHSEETKIKIGLKLKGRIHSEKTREKMRKSHIGRKAWNKGKLHKEETKIKISLSAKGRKPWNIGKYGYKTKPCSNLTKEKIKKAVSGKKHNKWKGGLYGFKHKFIINLKGKANLYKCEICKIKQAKNWSNKNHEYAQLVEDWQTLCVSCHRKYDYNLRKLLNYKYEKRFNCS